MSDQEVYLHLGFGDQIETHNRIAEVLSINPQAVKNWRDEFEPLYELEKHYLELKGLSNNSGGILFICKEWTNALNEDERYIICIVTNNTKSAY